MHEMSIALEICRIAEAHVGAEALPNVVTVAVDVGDDAGVDLTSLDFCLHAVLAGPPFARAQPVLVRCPGDILRVRYFELDDDHPAH